MRPRSAIAALAGAALAFGLAACASPDAGKPVPVRVAPAPGDVTPEAAAPPDAALPDAAPPDAAPASPQALTAPASAEALAALARERLEAANKATVVAFYETIFRDHQVAKAFDLYGGPVYIQHTPGAPNGRAALEAYLAPYFEDNPQARSDIVRVIAEGDLVALHVHARASPIDPGRAVVDIFRVENGKIVEHWDVVQPVPPMPENENSMF